MKVLKFGGSSVASPERISSVIEIVKPYIKAGEINALVVSAFGGITDQLIQASTAALSGKEEYKSHLAKIDQRHLDAVRGLISMQRQSSILAQVKVVINELEDVLHGIYLVRERTLRTLDFIMSFGERLSAYIISEAFRDKGIDAGFLDARKVVRTDNNFGYARVDFATTDRQVDEYFKANKGLQVITGFIGSSETGETTTLGRSGSDYTAAIFAAALKADSLEIWTDVDGMMTADPRKVLKAFTVPEMTYAEAMELSHFGAKVIFPATMQPVMSRSIPIWIKNTFNPTFAGTCIHGDANGKDLAIKGISSMGGVSLLSVEGSGLLGVVGTSRRLFGVLAAEKINVILISQASSEHSICLAIETNHVAKAKAKIEQEFQYEIKGGEMDEVYTENGLSIIAIVGEGMKHNPGTSGRMFNSLGKSGINIHAIAQGSSELNISAVIREEDTSKALNVLHEGFFLSDRKVLNLFLAGTGLIGNTLLKMIGTQREHLSNENAIEVNLVGVSNSRKMLFDERGIDPQNGLERLLEEGTSLDPRSFLDKIKSLNLSNSIFVDCTSSESVAEYYHELLNENISIVTPNKKANSGHYERYAALKAVARKRGVKFLYETNVGAGLPVINTLNDLLLSGDKVIRIQAVLSGTLNYIFSSFVLGKSFSAIVGEARTKGFTEPDPRDDLNGMDVGRKILILAREAGVKLEINDVKIENLVPKELTKVKSVDEFMSQLPKFDSHFEGLRADAATRGEKLRYMAVLDDSGVRTELTGVNQQHPFYSLSGSDNIILITTERYNERPMVIRGPGAGAEVTAAGVFADIIRIANYASL
ncbi:MAG TPA: bifunctional aspartate kinase/homoserine dehydrogenase I [Cyclobacteriaceae bacterium]|nr:bifunctional aspartate kinase/homoserine dehydrogenase I [Cyclobacteriaceae bacterium]